jgi:GNAT superfamily N-acetyltransferase
MQYGNLLKQLRQSKRSKQILPQLSSFIFMVMKIIIREMAAGDAKAVNILSKQLGYPLSIEQTIQNINAVLGSKDHSAFVAEYENSIVGWIGASQAIMIEVMPHCEINGLVIDQDHRGMGIGKLLVDKIKQWAKEKNNSKVGLRCNVKRTEAHLFYEHLGFTEIKQQKNFVITI